MTWHDQPMHGLALATTSADPTQARIVATATRTVNDGTNAPAALTIVATPAAIPDQAAAIHGITAETAATGIAPLAALAHIIGTLEDAAATGTPVVMFNASWVLDVIANEARAEGVIFAKPANLLIVDPMVIDDHINGRMRAGNKTLPATADRWGALQDHMGTPVANLAAAMVTAWRMGGTHAAVRDLDAQQLHVAQGQWRRDRVESLRTHAASRGANVA